MTYHELRDALRSLPSLGDWLLLPVAVAELKDKLEAFMAEQTVRLDRLDAATSQIAAVLQELRDKAVNGMTEQEVARFDGLIASLEQMGKDPANPLPAPPPPPAPSPA